jgi:uncharacterized membrane protein YphA (DoxX/SURF4 family)
MKLIANLSRILVGLEFIFSGFVKVVDPYGTGLKLQEYFEVFAGDLPVLSPFFSALAHNALAMSLVFCCLELVLGVALVFSFKMKTTSWMVLLLMLFFTFLTFYSAYFNKVTDCGCFGDFLKLKPWDSFLKDIISMFFILIIFFYRKKFGKSEMGTPMVLIAIIVSIGIGIYAIRYLPILDFLPYAAGKSIPKQMERPNVKPDLKYVFLDKKDNTEIESKEYLADTNRYKYVSSVVLNEDLLRAKITDYSIADSAGNDFTQQTFDGKVFFIVLKKKDGLEDIDFKSINDLANKLSRRKIKPMVITSIPTEEYLSFQKEKNIEFDYYTCDEKVLKTMARNNPCFVLLNDGIVVKKWSYNNIPTASQINELIISTKF